VKKNLVLIFILGLLGLAACTSPYPWWQGKPVSQMTPAELEEQDPEFWPMWEHLHGIGP